MTLRKALEPPDPGGADSDPRLGSFLLASAPFFFFFFPAALCKKPSLEAFPGCLPNQGVKERVCLPQEAGQLPFLVLEFV